MPSKTWDELLIHSETWTVAPFKFGYGKVISSDTVQWKWLLMLLIHNYEYTEIKGT